MKAIRLTDFIEPSQIKATSYPIPRPKRGEALIRIAAAGINPSDVRNAQGLMRHHTILPRILGRDYAGTVVEGPSEWLGVEVWGTGGERGFTVDGGFAEYMTAPIDSLRRKPVNLNMLQASTVGVPFVTAYSGLFDLCRARRGETVLIVGVTGAVGFAAASLARWKGLNVIGAVRNHSDVPQADMATVNLAEQDLAEGVRALTQGKGVDLCYNAVGGGGFDSALKSLKVHGRMVCISAMGGREVSIDLLFFYRNQLRLFGLDTLQIESGQSAEILEKIRPGFESGALRAIDAEPFFLDEAAHAFAAIAEGQKGKKALAP